jgi:hypothetical protein
MSNFLKWLISLLTGKPQTIPEPITYQVYSMSFTEMLTKLDQAKLDHPFGVLDSVYYYTTLEDFKTISSGLIQCGYSNELNDCEDMALQTSLDSSVKYKVNSVGLAVGSWNGSAHAFNIVYTQDKGFMLFEPQNGSLFDLDTNGYKVERVLI